MIFVVHRRAIYRAELNPGLVPHSYVLALYLNSTGTDKRIVAFITDSPLRAIRVHHGEPTAPPRIAPGRGQPWWEGAAAVHDPSADPLPDAALA